jgi:hypothetical protein
MQWKNKATVRRLFSLQTKMRKCYNPSVFRKSTVTKKYCIHCGSLKLHNTTTKTLLLI